MFNNLRRIFNQATGFDIVKWSGMHTDASCLYHALHKFKIDCVIDVGANEGQFVDRLREIGYHDKVISFEPVTSAYSKLSQKVLLDNKWSAVKIALGAQPESKQINVSEFSAFSSLLETSEFAKLNWSSARVANREMIDISTLDVQSKLQHLDNYKNMLLKIDVQGYELEVLTCAKSLFDRVDCIYTEVSFRSAYSNAPSFSETLDFLAAIGFFPSSIYPVTRTKDLSMNEADVLFVKRV